MINTTIRANLYRHELTERVIPFWLDNAPDPVFGGHFSCLTSTGRVFDTDKFLWMQCRYLWMCSNFVNTGKGIIDSSLRHRCSSEAAVAADFLLNHGRDETGSWYFALERNGKPRTAAYNIFTDVFALLGLAEFLGTDACPKNSTLFREVKNTALSTWQKIWERYKNPKGKYSKIIPGTRCYRPLNWPMIILNICLVIDDSPLAEDIGKEELKRLRFDAASDILEFHLDTEAKLLRERVSANGEYLSENMEGRLLTPGHGCETLAFLLEALVQGGKPLTDKLEAVPAIKRKIDSAGVSSVSALVCRSIKWVIESGWDTEDGGLFYYLDSEGLPPEKLEWDMKLWWVQLESAYAALIASVISGDSELLEWYERIHLYMWKNFRRNENPEWFGYLSRGGEPTHNLAGGKWKGFFHLPRALKKMIDVIERENISASRGTSEY